MLLLFRSQGRRNISGSRLGALASLTIAILFMNVPSHAQGVGSFNAQPYRIGPQDVLDVFVWREEDLSKSVVVRPDGGISFPLAGDIQVAGKTVKNVQAEITERMKAFIPEATVTVSVGQIAGYRIYVLGKVNSPGEYVLGTYVNVSKALAIAKGLNPFAEQGAIKIVRSEDGQQKVFNFNYADVIQGKNLQQNIVLQSGDMIMVP